jgi:Right handed beta helix region
VEVADIGEVEAAVAHEGSEPGTGAEPGGQPEPGSAEGAAVICLPAGTYGPLALSGAHIDNVTIEPKPGEDASLEGLTVAAGASNITIHNFSIGGGVSIGEGASHITIDHNDINGEAPGGIGEGVETLGVNCSSPNAPVYEGCASTPPATYITISSNRIHGYGNVSEDAIHLNNYHHVRVIGNDIYDIEEHGNHSDALQSVWGGSDLLFERNYEHDNQSQGFFIKDGDVAQVKVADNLFLRNDNEGLQEINVQVYNTADFTMTNNTAWGHQGDLIIANNSSQPLSATVQRNVEEIFGVLQEGGPEYALSEDYDIFATAPWTFTPGPHTAIAEHPEFANPAYDDYRLKSNPEGIGVDWSPSEYVYGPTGS